MISLLPLDSNGRLEKCTFWADWSENHVLNHKIESSSCQEQGLHPCFMRLTTINPIFLGNLCIKVTKRKTKLHMKSTLKVVNHFIKYHIMGQSAYLHTTIPNWESLPFMKQCSTNDPTMFPSCLFLKLISHCLMLRHSHSIPTGLP